ncbi:MAG: hypothetical protein ACFE8E_00925 [Candidatus Hodarchaeota archaeon]
MKKNNCLTGPKYCPDCGAELESYSKKCSICSKDFSNKGKKKRNK